MRTLHVAVAGLGFVGRETVRLLAANRERFRKRLGADVALAAVADRDAGREARSLGLPTAVLRVRDPLELARLPGIDIVVEALGGIDAPRALALASLSSGRHLVTSNKRMLSHCWDELRRAGFKGGGRLYFEGSVAGGIPILQALDNSFAANRIEAVYGILNGTTNYILSALERGGPQDTLETALRQAQAAGFAEKDPTMDLNGEDAAQKVSVLASLLTGRGLPPGKIARQGILGIGREDIEFAMKNLGRTPRLLGVLRLQWGRTVRLEAHVFPTLVPLDHPLAAVRRQYNAVMVKASHADDLMFYGKGAGPGPTASAVVGDVFMLCRDILGAVPPMSQPDAPVELLPISESVSPFYLRVFAQDKPGVLAKIAAALGRRGISIASIHQADTPAPAGVPIVLTTHPAAFGSFQTALRDILALKSVARRHTVLRMLS
jgi:homoserine dehydrogenase